VGSTDLTTRVGEGLRFLIVDESHDARVTLCAVLTHLGAECRHVARATDAVAVVGDYDPHAVVVEWMTGFGVDRDAIPTLREATSALVMVVTTTAPADAFSDHARADGSFMKPLGVETVEAICHAVRTRNVN
jgi:DNA-binding response OmpR family regulator